MYIHGNEGIEDEKGASALEGDTDRIMYDISKGKSTGDDHFLIDYGLYQSVWIEKKSKLMEIVKEWFGS